MSLFNLSSRISRKEFVKLVLKSDYESRDLLLEREDFNCYKIVFRCPDRQYKYFCGSSEEVLSLLCYLSDLSIYPLKLF